MGSKVVVTYKRKRFFSRSDHSPIKLHSDKPSDSKGSAACFNNHDESIDEHTLQKKDPKFGTCHDYSKDNIGETTLQYENCESEYCGQCTKKEGHKLQKCFSACTKQENSSVSNHTQNSTPEQKACSLESNLTQVTSYPNVTSVSGSSSFEERSKLNADQCTTLCNNNLVTERKLTSTLITFARRSKRNKENAGNDNITFKCTEDQYASVTPLAACCSLDLKNEKKPPEDINTFSSFSAPEAAMVMQMDNPVHSPRETAKCSTPAVFESSHEGISLLREKDNHGITVTPRDLPHEDENLKMPCNISTKRCFMSSLDLSISPPASRDIDCNKPLDCDFGETDLPGCLGVNDSQGSFSEVKTSQVSWSGNGSHVRGLSDGGKFIVPPPVKNNNCMQLFPENRVNKTLQLANDPENTARLLPPSLNTPRIHNLEQMINGRAYFSSSYDCTTHVQPNKAYQYFLPSTSNQADAFSRRHMMMLDSIRTRERSKSATWSEEELDCLWVGVRRHGLNNWDAMIRDRRLQFKPWRTEGDLADRWQDEQYRLFHGGPVSQAKYMTQPNFLANHTAGNVRPQQNPLQEYGDRNRPSVVHYMDLARNCQFQKPVNYLPGCRWGLINLSDGSDFVKEKLPHWLRQTVEIPKPSGPARNVVSSSCVPNFDYTENAPVQRRTESCVKATTLDVESGKSKLHKRQANNNKDELIIINSDASSEETISDDQSIRP